jgi:precorrin-6Y C5,15-methyltransferase (decarboxylating)
MQKPWLFVVGMGGNGLFDISKVAHDILKQADIIVSSARCLAHLPKAHYTKNRIPWPIPLESFIPKLNQYREKKVVILATGDPMHFGIGTTLMRHFPKKDILIVPYPSAFSLACARLGWSYETVKMLSVHGSGSERQPHTILASLYPNARILVLPRNHKTPIEIAHFLNTNGYGSSQMTAFSHMGNPNEQDFTATAHDWNHTVPDFHILAIKAISDNGTVKTGCTSGISDTLFKHDGMLTKQEIRAITLSNLKPTPSALLWDIGAGSGAITIEWLRSADSMQAICIEHCAKRTDYIRQNALNFGVPIPTIIENSVPQALENLPAPDAIFVGGGLSLPTICMSINALKTGGRLVTNAVTLESEKILLELFKNYGGSLTRIAVSRASPMSSDFHSWHTIAPVTQWSFEK